jgi:hypothetical protein
MRKLERSAPAWSRNTSDPVREVMRTHSVALPASLTPSQFADKNETSKGQPIARSPKVPRTWRSLRVGNAFQKRPFESFPASETDTYYRCAGGSHFFWTRAPTHDTEPRCPVLSTETA